MGNPPYSEGQKSENDNSDNLAYPRLDQRISETYAKLSTAVLSKGLYNSYVRAMRWASDRIDKKGIVAFVTNAGFVDGRFANGLRQHLASEFSNIYVFHLRGRRGKQTAGERAKQEGGQIFGAGSGAPIAITLMVKNPASSTRGDIRFHDIGEYLSREQKLGIVSRLGSVQGIAQAGGFRTIVPDEHGDWLKQRDNGFAAFMPLGDKKSDDTKLFDNFSLGVVTNRDAWAYNASNAVLSANMASMIAVYNDELRRFDAVHGNADRKTRSEAVDGFVTTDPQKISWTHNLKEELAKGKRLVFDAECPTPSLYRPFTRQWLYYSRTFNERVYQMPRIFPMADSAAGNCVICVSGGGEKVSFSAMMADVIPSLHMVDIDGSQCFPRYLYDATDEPEADEKQAGLFPASATNGLTQRDAITDEGLRHFTDAYPGEVISKDDVFYYVYGLLHSEEYRERYADNLTKQLPRIPLMKRIEDFRAFVAAGRRLGDLHVNFESAEPYPVTIKEGDLRLANITDPVAYYRVEKMKFAGKRPNLDKTTVIYNPRITITGIPLEAYDYVVNGKPALEWVMERQCVKTDPASGIVNDANRYAIETVGDPASPFKLFCRIITVSLETMKIVKSLPALDIREGATAATLKTVEAVK